MTCSITWSMGVPYSAYVKFDRIEAQETRLSAE
jgi:hypothetical protein